MSMSTIVIKAQELLYLLENADARAVVFDAEFAPLIAQIRAQLPQLTVWIEVPQADGAVAAGNLDYRTISGTGDDRALSLQTQCG